MTITADDANDVDGAGDLLSDVTSVLQGHTVTLDGFDVTTGIVTADVGDVTITASNEITLAGLTTATAAQVIATAAADDVNVNANLVAATNVDIEATVGTVSHSAGQNISAGDDVSLDAGTLIDVDGTITTGSDAGDSVDIGTSINSPNITIDGNISADVITIGGPSLTGSITVGGSAAATTLAVNGIVTLRSDGAINQADGGSIQSATADVFVQSDTADVEIGSLTATAGNIFVTALTGSINDSGDDSNVDLMAASSITLLAQNNIGGLPAAGTAADVRGDIEVADGSNVTASSTGAGNVVLESLGTITLADVDTADGAIDLIAAGTIAATDVQAGGAGSDSVTLQTTAGGIAATLVTGADSVSLDADAGDITIGSLTATAGTATVNADSGSISDAAADTSTDITAGIIDLNAATGIGNLAALELAGTTLTIDNSTSGNVDVDNSNVAAVSVASLTTAGGGNIAFDNSGAGGVSFGTVATSADASPAVAEDDIALSSTGGDLIITTSVEADGMGDVSLVTAISGNVVLTGLTTADGDLVVVDSAGDINGAGLVTADTVDLDAASGIGNTSAVQLAAINISSDTAAGNIDVDNVQAASVSVTSLTTVGGTVTFDQSGGGDLTVSGPVSSGAAGTAGGTITISAADNLIVDAVVSSAGNGASGGTLTVAGATVNASPVIGAGNVVLSGGSLDTVVSAAIANAGNLSLSAFRDVLIQSTVTTTAGGNITITADSDGITNTDVSGTALGGVAVSAAGQINSAGTVTVTGSDLLNAGASAGTTESIQIDANGSSNQIIASGDITLQNSAAAADIVISGRVLSSAGSIAITSTDEIRTSTTIEANTGSIDFNNAVVLTGTTVVVAGSNATFDLTVDGSFDISLDVDGATTFVGAVGATSVIGDGTGAAISINGDGATEFQSTVSTASGIAQANNAGVLTFRDNITAASGDSGSTFNANVVLDGLVFTSGGTIAFGDTAADDVTTSASAVSITTDAANADVVFNAATTATTDLTVSVGVGGITVNAVVDGNSNIVYNSAGTTDINSAIGSSTAVASLTTDAPGSTTLASNVTAQGGTITINDMLVLNADVTLTDSGASGIFLNNTVNSDGTARGLTLTTTNAASAINIGDSAADSVGAISALGQLTVNAAGTLAQAANIAGLFLLTYDAVGAVAITGSSAVAGNVDIDSASTIDISNSITTTAGGTVSIDGTGLTTLTSAADITADGTVSFGAAKTGALATAADVSTADDNITFNQAVTLTGPVELNSGAGGGNITFSSPGGTVNGNEDLTIAAGTGNVEFDAVMGGTLAIDNLVITSASQISFDAAVTAATVTANGTTIDGSGLVTANSIDLDAVNGIGATTALNVNAVVLEATNTTSGVIHINESDDVAVGAISNGTRNVTLNAGGNITDGNGGATNVTAGVLTVDAAGRIDLDTNITSLDASTSLAGNINIDEADAIVLTDIDTANGSITVGAGGAITATDVDAEATDSDANDISLTTTAGDIAVISISAGMLGDVSLTSAAAITEDGNSATLLVGDVLTSDAAGAITLDTTVASANVSSTGAGDVDIDETDAITLTDVDTSNGSINVTTGGAIVATDVAAAGSGSDVNLNATAGNIQATLVTAADSVTIDADVGDVTLGSIAAATTATITADAGRINDADANPDSATDITATTVDLNAAQGIGNLAHLELAATSISADVTAAGDLDIDNVLSTNVLVSSLTSMSGNINFDQTGGGNVTFTGPVDSSDDSVAGGNITLVSANGLTVDSAANVDSSAGVGGDLVISGATINGSVVVGAGDVTIQGGGFDLIIAATLAADDIALSAARDIIVAAQVSAAKSITVAADSNSAGDASATDAAGGVWIQTAGQIASGQDTVSITGSDVFAAANVQSVLVDSDGTNNQVQANGNIIIGDGTNARVNASTIINGRIETLATAGTIDITGEGSVQFGVDGDVTGVDGAITITADTRSLANGGAVTMADGAVIQSAAGIITLAADGNISIGQVSNTSSVQITSDNGMIVDAGNAGGADVVTGSVAFTALTGIGSDADAIESQTTATTSTLLLAATTDSGDIHVSNSGSLTVGVVAGVVGVTVVDDSAVGADVQDSTNDNITLTAASPLTVNAAISNNDGSNISLNSINDGGLDDHLTINAALTITGGDGVEDADGNINLNAGTDLVINDSLSTDAAGSISATAARSALLNSGFLATVNGHTSVTATAGQVAMTDGTAIQSTDGDVAVVAQTNVSLSSITTVGNADVTAITGAISDGGNTAIDVAANVATLNAATGIGNGDPLETTVATLNATNTTSGTIQIAETDSLAIDTVNNAARPVTISAGGDVTDANSAAVNVTAGVFTIDAAGGIDLDTTVNSLDASTSALGDININETDTITLTDVDTTNGAITVVAGGTITATDVDSSAIDDDSNDISIASTMDDVLLGLVNAGSDNDVAITAAGAISESGSDAAIDVLAGDAEFVATTGIGNANALETTLTNLAFSNTTSGAVQITNSQSLTVASIGTLAASANLGGNIELCVTAGDLAINSALSAVGNTIRLGAADRVTQSTAGVINANDLGVRANGDILLATTTARNNVDNVFAAESTTAGQIQFSDNGGFTVGTVAGAAVNMGDCFTTTVGVQTAAGDVQLTSDSGDIMVDDNVTAGGAGDVNLATTTSGSVTVTGVVTTANTVTINSADEIFGDSTNTAADIVADSVVLTAINGIGDAPPLELAAASISAVTTDGNIDLDNVLATPASVSSLQTGTGTITFDQSGGGTVNFANVTTGNGAIDLENAGADLTVGSNVTAGGAGDVSLATTGSGNVILTGVTTADGNTITINSADQIVGDAGDAFADLVATNLNLTAVNGIGVGQPLEISASTLTFANTTGPVQISNDQSLTLGATSTAGDFELCLTNGDLLIDDTLAATGGTVRVQTVAGSVTESATGEIIATNLGVNASGDITLATATNAADVFAAESTGGSIVFTEVDGFSVNSVSAGDCFVATAGVQTSFTTGTVTLNSGGTLETFQIVQSVNGETELNVTSGMLITLGSVRTMEGAVDINVLAGDAIVSRDITTTGGDIDVDAAISFFTTAPFSTDSGSISIDGGVSFGNTGTIASTSGNVDLAADFVAQNANVSTGNNGTIDVTASSFIVMAPGVSSTTFDGDTTYTSAGSTLSQLTTASGDIDVDATTGTADLNELISSTSGSIDITGSNVTQDANITTAAAGTIDVTATNGDITMASGAVSTAADGNISYDATNNVNLSQLITAANVVVTADSDGSNAGAITDNLAGEAANVTADEVALRAATGIGSADDIDTNVRLVAASTESGSILLQEIDGSGIVVGTTDSLSGLTVVDAAAVSDSGNDHIVVRSNGDITVEDQIANDDHGNILLSAETIGSGITTNADISTAVGNIVLAAVDNVVVDEAVSTTDVGSVHVVSSTGSVSITDTDSSSSGISATGGTGDVLLQAATSISLGDNIASGSGDVGIQAGTDFVQETSVAITTLGGDAVVSASTTSMAAGSSIDSVGTTAGDILLVSTAGDVAIESVNAGNGSVAIDSAANIVDQGAGELTNVTAATLQLTAVGMIGDADLTNSVTNNGNAINTSVDTLAASSANGIYVRESDGITVGTASAVAITVDANNLSNTGINAGSTTQQTASDSATSDLTTSAGPIKLVADAGQVTVADGDADGFGINAGSDGDVLLEARNGSVVVDSDVRSDLGHVTVVATDDVDLNEDVRTGGSGTIFLSAADQLTIDDGPDADTNGLVTTGGNVLVKAATATINADINTNGGAFGIELTGSGGLTGSTNTAGGDVLLRAGGDLTLDSLVAGTGTVQIEAAGDVIDANDGTVVGTLNIVSDSLRISSGGKIGDRATSAVSSVNANAIDISVNTLAANSDSGIYLQETNGVTVDTVSSIAINVQQVHFNSTDTAVNSSAASGDLADLTTATDGQIKLATLAGDIQLNDGSDADGMAVSAAGLGDVLIEARTAGDIIADADVVSSTGNITFNAADDAVLNQNVTTSGKGTIYLLAGNVNAGDAGAGHVDGINISGVITTADGDILAESLADISQTELVNSSAGDVGLIATRDVIQSDTGDITTGGDVLVEGGNNWTMASGTVITATGGEVDGHALAGDITLGRINSTNVALTAECSVTDGNDILLNVDATTLSVRANNGLIGNHDNSNGMPEANINAIDTQVTTLAANAELGIYISEADALVVDTVNAVTVDVNWPQQVNFNDSITSVGEIRTTAGLEDLTTDTNGPIKVQATAGTLTVNGGSNASGVIANGTGDVLLQAVDAASDVVINGTVASGTGNITLDANDDVTVNNSLTTTGTGTIVLLSANGTSDASGAAVDGIAVGAGLTNNAGDILLSSAQDIVVAAAINSIQGDIGVIAAVDVEQTDAGDITTGGDVLIEAGDNWTMSADAVITAFGGQVDGHAIVGNLTLGRINSTNIALTAGQSIVDANAGLLNVDATTLSLQAGSGAIGTNSDALETQITTLAANAETGIFVSEADDLIIDTVAAVTVSVDAPLRVNFNSTTTAVPEIRATASLEDLTTEANGPIKVVATNNLTVNGRSDPTAVSANGTGDVLLDAVGGSLVINDDVLSGTGHITLEAASQLDLGVSSNTPVTVQTAGSGSVVVIAETADIVMQPDATIQTASGSVHLAAATDVLVGRIQALADVAITATTGSITDADAAADSSIDISANNLLLNSGGTVGNIAGDNAIETQVTTVASSTNGEIYIAEVDDLIVGSVTVVTERVDFNGARTNVVDALIAGIDSSASDVLLKTGETLVIAEQLNAATADVRIVSGANISQTATGIVTADDLGIILNSANPDQDIQLGSASNVIGTLAAQNTSESGDITVFDSAGDLVVGQVTSQSGFATTTGVDSNAGDINITAEGDLTVSQNINAAHNSITTSIDEAITLVSRNGDFILDDTIIVTSDEDPTPGVFDDITGDELTIIAGSGGSNGVVNLGDNIQIRTDGGVARQVAPRPTAFAAAPTTGAENAFVTLSDAETMRSALLFTNGDFLGELELVFGVSGEENLEVVIDWGVVTQTSLIDSGAAGNATSTNPGEFAFGLDDADKSIFFIDEGGAAYTIPHLYDPAELLTTINDRNGRQNNPNIVGVRFSVAQHESINIWGENATDPAGVPDTTPPTFQQPAVDDAGNPIVPDQIADATGSFIQPEGQLALLSSTDPNGLRNFTQEATNQSLPLSDNRVVTSTGRPEGQAEWEFLAGPSPGLVPVEQFAQQAFDAPLVEAPPIILTATEVPGDINLGPGAAGDSAVGTEVYLQIRRHFESDAEAEVVIQRITDNSFIANRDSFEQFVEENPVLQDGDGYEVWLITETGGQKVARPIVEFEITGGRPGPATEELPDTFEPYELKELEFEQSPEDSENTESVPPLEIPKQDDDLAATQGNINRLDPAVHANHTDSPDERLEQSHSGNDENGDGVALGLIPLIGMSRAARWKRRQTIGQDNLSMASRAVRKMRQLTEADSE